MITIIFLALFSHLKAPDHPVAVILRTEPIQPYEAIWNATCEIESGFNPYAIGDKHLKDYSYGIVQIRQSRIDDYYEKTGIRYSVTDMFDPVKSREVFLFYASQFHSSDTEAISRAWNAGPNWKKVKASEKYYQKVKAVL